jgi:hypothetical protein
VGVIEEQDYFSPVLYAGAPPGMELAALITGLLRIAFYS